MGRKKGALARFTCTACGVVDLVTGGQSNYKCAACRDVAGLVDLTSPQKIAHKAVARAIKNGELKKPSLFTCLDCGGPATEYDHRDYSKPLEVTAVCRGCNLRRGPALNHLKKQRTPTNTPTPTGAA
jgi:hypothetical protein